MPLYEIQCPFHGAKETIEVPDSDDKHFEGEVACATLQPGSAPFISTFRFIFGLRIHDTM